MPEVSRDCSTVDVGAAPAARRPIGGRRWWLALALMLFARGAWACNRPAEGSPEAVADAVRAAAKQERPKQ